jgi:hypothetical protein
MGLVLTDSAAARDNLPDSPLADALEIVVLDHKLLAIAAERGGQRVQPLELGERVLWHKARGRVGVVLTNRRILAVASRSGSWQDARYRSTETPPRAASLGDRVALILTNQRVLGFDGGSGNLIEQTLGPRESILSTGVGENVVVVATDRRALGLSPFNGGFFEAKLHLGERLESVSALANHATIATSRRLLTFRASSGTWEERRLDLP